MANTVLVNQTELAEIMGKTPATIANWRRAGMPAGKTQGKTLMYNVKDVVDWYIGRELPSHGDLPKEEALRRKMVADMRSAEMDAEQKAGELMLVSDFMKILSEKITTARNQLLTVKSTMMPALRAHAGDQAVILQNMLGDEIERILNELAEQ